ncbi:MAG: methyltransferase domain-containing protein [Flavobacteriales bacterium]|nr:methyltransferase domain-containing protein [Flavobacteriales bacterium]
MELKHNADYWQDRWQSGQTGWDVGYPSTPLAEYIDQLENKELKILIPGAGNAYEAEYLYKAGFKNVYVIDIAFGALENIKKRIPTFPESHLIEGDFFEHNNQYDIILEQTFFCALHPSERKAYCKKMIELLKPSGKLAGVLFNDSLFTDHPPYGGFKADYEALFEPYFSIVKMETAYNSIPPRAERELFILMIPK